MASSSNGDLLGGVLFSPKIDTVEECLCSVVAIFVEIFNFNIDCGRDVRLCRYANSYTKLASEDVRKGELGSPSSKRWGP